MKTILIKQDNVTKEVSVQYEVHWQELEKWYMEKWNINLYCREVSDEIFRLISKWDKWEQVVNALITLNN